MKKFIVLFLFLSSCSQTKQCKVIQIGNCKTDILNTTFCSVKCSDQTGRYILDPIEGAVYEVTK